MVYMDTNRSNTHADPPLGSRWAQMWVHMWAETLVIFLVYVTKGNISDLGSQEGVYAPAYENPWERTVKLGGIDYHPNVSETDRVSTYT